MAGSAYVCSQSVVKVELGIGTAAPGERVSVPITLSGAPAPAVSRIVLEISFPAKTMSFVEAAKRLFAGSQDLAVKAEIQGGDDTSRESSLRVEISASDVIPRGELVDLIFELSKEVQLNDEINLKNVTRAVRAPDGQLLETAGSDGLITVLSGSIFACFFYMH